MLASEMNLFRTNGHIRSLTTNMTRIAMHFHSRAAPALLLLASLALPAHAAAPAAGELAPGFSLDGKTGPVNLVAYKGKYIALL